MTPFDPIRAQREILAGLADVYDVIGKRKRAAEFALATADADYNALAKIERFVADLMVEAREKLEDLETQAETQGKTGSPP